MLKEIKEEPDKLKRILLRADDVREIAREIKNIKRVFVIGRGTSDNAGLYGKYIFEIICRIPSECYPPSIFTYYNVNLLNKNSLVLLLSQSGETPDVIRGIEAAKNANAPSLLITNERDSTGAEMADYVIFTDAGREEAIAATKTYVSELLELYLLCSFLSNLCDIPFYLPEKVKEIIKIEKKIREIAYSMSGIEKMICIGRGVNYPTALEASLKLKETSYIFSEAISGCDLWHGPLAIIEDGFPIMALTPDDRLKKPLLELIQKLKDVRAYILSVSDSHEVNSIADKHIEVPYIKNEFLTPITHIVPVQIFSNYLAYAKGINPDEPRYLTKVTKR